MSNVKAANVESVERLHLEVHPSVVFKLGEDLITEDSQAVAELIKNSYDADATFVRVDVNTTGWFHRATATVAAESEIAAWQQYLQRKDAWDARVAGAADEPARGEDAESDPAQGEDSEPQPPAPELVRGRIAVVDDGSGMDGNAIRDGWLTVSASYKRRMKDHGQKTRGKRTPLGDKGLGRLGVQRLGDLVRLQSIPRTERSQTSSGSHRFTTLIDWRAFLHAEKLSGVVLTLESELIEFRRSGSVVEVFGLHNPDFWSRSSASALDRDLIGIVSPYDAAEGFDVRIVVDGSTVDIRERAREVLARAPIIYTLNYFDGILHLEGRMRAAELRANRGETIVDYKRLVEPDNGFAFATWLLETRPKRAAEIELRHGDDDHFLRFSTQISFEDLRTRGAEDLDWVDPGLFAGEISSIDLRDDASMFDAKAEWREFARLLQGVKVFRNGFGIRLSEDWLNLAKKWTGGTSFYSLRPENTVGYINVTTEHNAALEETTSREQFRDTSAYRGFYGLLSAWSDWSAVAQSLIRRAYNDYRKELASNEADLAPTMGPAEIASSIAKGLSSAQASIKTAMQSREKLSGITKVLDVLATQRDAVASQIFVDPAVVEGIDSALRQIQQVRATIDEVLVQLQSVVEEQGRLQAGVTVLQAQLDSAQEQIGLAWESVAAGLSAETLSHEVAQISDRLRARSQQIKPYFQERTPPDARALAYAEYVRVAGGELGREVARLNPALRYRRDRRAPLRMSTALGDLLRYHRDRLANENIAIDIRVERDFEVLMNQGKFTQVFDNLLLNSEYWCKVALRRGDDHATISLVVREPVVLISDSGSGVDASVQDSLLDPFVTTKPEQQGRGLGLFVVRQILDADHGEIDLLPELNQHGRPYIFRLRFESLTKGKDTPL